MGRRLLGEARAQLAWLGEAQPLVERGGLLERADRRPQGSLQLLVLRVQEALERERVADVAAEVLEHAGLCLARRLGSPPPRPFCRNSSDGGCVDSR
jgi:hypothetical protein